MDVDDDTMNKTSDSTKESSTTKEADETLADQDVDPADIEPEEKAQLSGEIESS